MIEIDGNARRTEAKTQTQMDEHNDERARRPSYIQGAEAGQSTQHESPNAPSSSASSSSSSHCAAAAAGAFFGDGSGLADFVGGFLATVKYITV